MELVIAEDGNATVITVVVPWDRTVDLSEADVAALAPSTTTDRVAEKLAELTAIVKRIEAAGQEPGRGRRWLGSVTKALASGQEAAGKVASGTLDISGKVASGTLDIGSKVASGTRDIGGKVASGTLDIGGKVASGTLDIGSKVASGTRDIGGKVASGTLDISGKVASGARSATDQVTVWFNMALGSTDFAWRLDVWMRETFAAGKGTAFDKAMDANYIASHIGGGYHRLFDGGHDLVGAWRAIGDAMPDLAMADKVQGYFGAVWKDFVTPMGLPITTLPKEQFDTVAAALSQHIGVSRAWLADMASLNATELLGGTVAILSVALNWSQTEVKEFSGLAGSLGVSALAGANPLLAVIAVVSLAQAYHKAAHGSGFGELAKGLAKGGFGTGVSLAAASLLPGAWVGIMVGVCAGVLAHKAWEKGEKVMADVDWGVLAAFVQRSLRARMTGASVLVGAPA